MSPSQRHDTVGVTVNTVRMAKRMAAAIHRRRPPGKIIAKGKNNGNVRQKNAKQL
jgi:hypothetical protein